MGQVPESTRATTQRQLGVIADSKSQFLISREDASVSRIRGRDFVLYALLYASATINLKSSVTFALSIDRWKLREKHFISTEPTSPAVLRVSAGPPMNL